MGINHRKNLLDIFNATVNSVSGRSLVNKHYLTNKRPRSETVYLIAIGKAAESMTLGVMDSLTSRIVQGIVITKSGHFNRGCLPTRNFHCYIGGHPYPNSDSLAAGRALIKFIKEAPIHAHFLFLISGGASAIVEVLKKGVGLTELQKFNRWLLGSGLDIYQINSIRKSISDIKGGGLVKYLAGRRADVLLLSDVPGDDISVIGSGLLVPSSTLTSELNKNIQLPSWLQKMMTDIHDGPQLENSAFKNVGSQIIGNNQLARENAAKIAEQIEYNVFIQPDLIVGDASKASIKLANFLLKAPAGFYIWGGETTIQLPPNPGRGGRCQSFALEVASLISQHNDIYFLAAGTDGSDGPTEHTGAIVDGQTISRGTRTGKNVKTTIECADAGHYLEQTNDLIKTGPTGTNVMDLMFGLKVVSK